MGSGIQENIGEVGFHRKMGELKKPEFLCSINQGTSGKVEHAGGSRKVAAACENGLIKGTDSSGHTVYCIYPDGTAEFGDGSAKFAADRSFLIDLSKIIFNKPVRHKGSEDLLVKKALKLGLKRIDIQN